MGTAKRRASKLAILARATAAVFGSFALSVAVALCIARLTPASIDARYAAAHYLLFPIWTGAACVGFAAKSGARAWAAYAALTLAFIVLSRVGG